MNNNNKLKTKKIHNRIITTITIFVFGCIFSVYAQDNNSYKTEGNMDTYRWMENDRERTTQWLNLKSDYSRFILDALPWRDALEKRLNELVNVETTLSDFYYTAETRFYLRSTSELPYQRLFVLIQDKAEKLLIDPPVGSGINFFTPSHDGRYVAYGLSINGSENTEIKIVNVYNGTVIEDSIPQVRFPNVVWNDDNHSFFYSKNLPIDIAGESMPRQSCGEVYIHRLGDKYENDLLIFDKSMVDELEQGSCENINLYSSINSNYLIVYASPSISGYGGYLYSTQKHLVDEKKVNWTKIVDINENISDFVFSGKWLYLAGYNSSSGYILSRLNLDIPKLAREEIIDWSNGELTGLATSSDSLYITYHTSGIRKFVRIPFSDIKNIQDIPKPFDGEVTAIFSHDNRQEILFTLQDWLKPPGIFRYNPQLPHAQNTGLISSGSFSFSNYEVEEQWVTSNDNVRIPLTIIHQRGMKLDGSAPIWLTTYGAYGVSNFPNFDASRLLWLEKGGAIAIAHVRGGGELGPSWHEGGRATNKENSISDFIRCAEYLVNNKYTKPSKLVISGESAGGIIIGMAMTRHPDLFSAAAIDAGILNTSRLDKIPIGPMNFKEFGSPFTEQGMRGLLKIDAYLHLNDGVKYPPVLLTVGLNDERVSPWQTAKFAARLQDINKEWKTPVLVLADKASGHTASSYDVGDSKFIDIVSFFIWKTSD